MKKDSQLPTHPARTRRRVRVRRNSNSLEPSILMVAVDDGPPKGHPLGARRDRVARVLDVGAEDVLARVGQQCRADAEVAVGAVGAGLGVLGVRQEGVEFGGGEVVGCAGLGDG